MKIKNIVFSGFMASILMAGGAYAATDYAGSLTTKTYVDTAYQTAINYTDAEIADLDATQSQTAGADGLALSITEVDGKVTAISGSIAANTYDAYGAAGNAETAAKNYADSLNTAMNTRVTAAESSITTLEGDADTAGSVAYQIADAISDVNSSATELAGRVKTLEDAGYITKDVADLTNYTTTDDMNTALEGKQDTIDSTHKLSAGLVDGLAPVATSGAYSDLNSTPTTLAGYGITDAYTKTEVDTELAEKADAATTLAGYGITDAYTKTETYTKTEVDTALDGKQDTISDLSTIRTNAEAGKDAADTIETYGDIVTHDVDEFATAAQGAKAESAVQNLSDLGITATAAELNKTSSLLPVATTACETNYCYINKSGEAVSFDTIGVFNASALDSSI